MALFANKPFTFYLDFFFFRTVFVELFTAETNRIVLGDIFDQENIRIYLPLEVIQVYQVFRAFSIMARRMMILLEIAHPREHGKSN